MRLCNYVDVYRNDKVQPNSDSMQATATNEEISRFRLHIGDTVFTKDSEDPSDIGVSAYVEDTATDFVCGYHLAIARPDPQTHARYLTWALRSRQAMHHLSAHAAGISRYGLAIADLRGTPVPAWGFEEQRRIADFLDDRVARIDQMIGARSDQLTLVQGAYEAWLHEWIVDLGRKYGWAQLRRFGARIEQGWSPEADSTSAEGSEPGILRLGSVRDGEFDPHENKAFLPNVAPRAVFAVHEGDLLVTRANTPDLVGDAAVVRGLGGMNLYLSDLVYRVGLADYGHNLASACLRTPDTRSRIRVIARGTSGSMPKLRGDDLLRLELPRVPRHMHERLSKEDVRQRSARSTRVFELRRAIRLLEELKQSLITAAVTGELDVTTASSGIPG